jgi:FHS family L-fucose permease-like MFS transporter
MGIAGALILLAILFWILRTSAVAPRVEVSEARLFSFALLARRPRLAFGLLSIFLYVGAEVAIGSLMVNYLMLPKTLGATAATGGRLVAFYWGAPLWGA